MDIQKYESNESMKLKLIEKMALVCEYRRDMVGVQRDLDTKINFSDFKILLFLIRSMLLI